MAALASNLAAAAPEPILEAPRQVPAEARRFTLYFVHAQATITPDAGALLRLAGAYQNAASGKVLVIAHTDRLGSRAYNLRLSRRRAAAVGQRLVRLGVPARAVTLRWAGETQPPHPTVDEMREPLNRCAVILISPGQP